MFAKYLKLKESLGLLAKATRVAALDKMSVTQKSLKLAEEVGELARAVLIMEQAHGTKYRNIEPDEAKEDVLEEIVDVILATYSIVVKIGFSNSQLASMIQEKLDKWEQALKR